MLDIFTSSTSTYLPSHQLRHDQKSCPPVKLEPTARFPDTLSRELAVGNKKEED
jgi:hypothetical protein